VEALGIELKGEVITSGYYLVCCERETTRATNMAWRMPFPPSRMPASIELFQESYLSVCLETWRYFLVCLK
jgi:hypothetical protein